LYSTNIISDANDKKTTKTTEQIRKIKSMPEFPQQASEKSLTEAEKKHTIEELTTPQITIPSKEAPKLVSLDIKEAKQMEKSVDSSQLSPPLNYDSPKRDLRSGRGSSTSFVSIPEDSITMDMSSATGHEGRVLTSSTHSVKSVLYSGVFGKEGPTQGGINPSFLFLQLYHANFFGSIEERPLRLPNDEVKYHTSSNVLSPLLMYIVITQDLLVPTDPFRFIVS
jgi:hypothetical protein